MKKKNTFIIYFYFNICCRKSCGCYHKSFHSGNRPYFKNRSKRTFIPILFRCPSASRCLGARLLHAADAENLPYYIARPGSDGAVANRGWEVYPGSGAEDFFDPALAVRHVDGNLTTILHYQTHEINKIDDNVTETVIHLKDDVYPVSVRLYYISYAKENVIKTWTEIEHTEKSQSH